jgi:hypothetical protein
MVPEVSTPATRKIMNTVTNNMLVRGAYQGKTDWKGFVNEDRK